MKPSRLLILVGVLSLFSMRHAYAEFQSGIELKDKKAFQGFEWQTLEAGTLRVNWYHGDANFGQAALGAAQAGLRSISTLMPLDLVQPIEVFIYANTDDLRGAVAPGGEDWVAGHADPARGVVMVVIEPGAEQSILMEQRIPHELMHVIL